MNLLGFLNRSLGGFNIKGIYIEARYWQAIAIVFLIFLLVLMLARLRHVYVDWSFKPAISMLVIGFLLAVILEGFLIIGGKTIFTQVLGWRNAPKPISTVLDEGRSRLINVLGVNESPSITVKGIVNSVDSLSQQEVEELKNRICQ